MRLVRPPLFVRAALLSGRVPVFAHCTPEEAPCHGGLPLGAYEHHACAAIPLEAVPGLGAAPQLSPIEQRSSLKWRHRRTRVVPAPLHQRCRAKPDGTPDLRPSSFTVPAPAFTGEVHRLRARFSPVNFTDFPRVRVPVNTDGHDGFAYPVKRIVQNAERGWLRSDNPERPSLEPSAESTPIAQLVTTIKPETLGPVIGERLAPDEIGAAFGLASATLLERTARCEGRLFVVITDKGHFTEPDRLQTIITDRRPGETAFVLARPAAGASFRYCGVARWLEPDRPWSLPALVFQTWRALGRGRECSRRLPAAAIEGATTFLDALLLRASTPPGTWLARDGERCRILEHTPAAFASIVATAAPPHAR
jgi:hypothetical protein